ncbi:MAG TPA: hypothetical protein VG673_08435 [Actinomycetota bacterium]|nr:hypothetical protein [Actinomycetota bacterium]
MLLCAGWSQRQPTGRPVRAGHPGGAAGLLDENGPDELLRQVRATKRSDDACAVYLLRF